MQSFQSACREELGFLAADLDYRESAGPSRDPSTGATFLRDEVAVIVNFDSRERTVSGSVTALAGGEVPQPESLPTMDYRAERRAWDISDLAKMRSPDSAAALRARCRNQSEIRSALAAIAETLRCYSADLLVGNFGAWSASERAYLDQAQSGRIRRWDEYWREHPESWEEYLTYHPEYRDERSG